MAFTSPRLGEFDAVTRVKVIPLWGGKLGVRKILSVMARLVKDSYRHPQIKQAAIRITAGTPPGNIDAIINQIAYATKSGFEYSRDNRSAEEISTPLVHSIRYLSAGKTWGDCDDLAVWQAAIARSIGLIPRFVAIATGSDPANKSRLNHVRTEILNTEFPRKESRWVSLDSINPNASEYGRLVWKI